MKTGVANLMGKTDRERAKEKEQDRSKLDCGFAEVVEILQLCMKSVPGPSGFGSRTKGLVIFTSRDWEMMMMMVKSVEKVILKLERGLIMIII